MPVPCPEETALVMLTLNAGRFLDRMIPALSAQKFMPSRFLVIDSGSEDATVETFSAAGASVHRISPAEFDHGGTRQQAIEMLPEALILIFLTQDAIPVHPEAFANLVSAFEDPATGAAYGRQLPHPDASPLGAHARLFNYPGESHAYTVADAKRYGIKAAFSSNSFSAYRRTALQEAGGFPSGTISGEDTLATAAILVHGWTKRYVADACVYHSHNYGLKEEFNRYFDIGVMHSSASWLIEGFGRPESEGGRFVASELSYLRRHGPLLIPWALVRTASKYLGYRLGLLHAKLPLPLKRRLSMNRGYWSNWHAPQRRAHPLES